VSWWTSDRTGQLVGDPPADRVGGGLERASAAFRAGGGALPSLAQVLGAVAAALARVAPEALDRGGARNVHAAVARLEEGGEVRGEAAGAPPEMVDALAEAFLAVRGTYESVHDRKPTLAEAMAVVDLVLGAAPEEYASDGGARIAAIDAVTDGG
jgi:hypothetical protein